MSIVKNIAKTVALTAAFIGAIEVAGRVVHLMKTQNERKLNNAIIDVFNEIGLDEADFDRILPKGAATIRKNCASSEAYDLFEPWKGFAKTKEQFINELKDGVFKQSIWEQAGARANVLYVANKETEKVAKIIIQELPGIVKFKYEIIKLK